MLLVLAFFHHCSQLASNCEIKGLFVFLFSYNLEVALMMLNAAAVYLEGYRLS